MGTDKNIPDNPCLQIGVSSHLCKHGFSVVDKIAETLSKINYY